MSDVFRHANVLRLVRLAIEEDVGRGDVTTAAIVAGDAEARGIVRARGEIVVAGLPIAPVVFEALGAGAAIERRVGEGEVAAAGAVLLEIRARTAPLLAVERVLLNFLQRMCGVATLTRRFVRAAGTGRARIADTRKTVPGWRLLDKYAVRTGGGQNHRFGLDDGVLVKDNHVAACGSVGNAVARARAAAGHLVKVEVECDTLAQVDEALAAGADAILLDNMTTSDMADAVRRVAGRALVEASGNMTLERVPEVAATGVDLISVGALTHSAPAADLTLEIEPAS